MPIYVTLPAGVTKTTLAKQTIIDILKNNSGNPIQHKEIVSTLKEALDAETKQPIFTVGNINGGFNSLNRKLTNYNVIKYKNDGGVYYKYTEDQKELEKNLEVTKSKISDEPKEEFVELLSQTLKSATTLKSQMLDSEVEFDEDVFELIKLLAESNLELFMLKKNMLKK